MQSNSALVTELRSKMIFCRTTRTVIGQFATRHCDERAFGSLNDLEVTDDEAAIERQGSECLQTLIGVAHQFDANLGDFHNCSP